MNRRTGKNAGVLYGPSAPNATTDQIHGVVQVTNKSVKEKEYFCHLSV